MEYITNQLAIERARIMAMIHDTNCVIPENVVVITNAIKITTVGSVDFTYISGQISCASGDYVDEFDRAERKLAATEANIINPARIVIYDDRYERYMSIDTSILCAMAAIKRKYKSKCCIHMLKSHPHSKGAQAELALAKALKLTVTYE